jgi:hypothetical protein
MVNTIVFALLEWVFCMNISCFSITISIINVPTFHSQGLYEFESRARVISLNCLFTPILSFSLD